MKVQDALAEGFTGKDVAEHYHSPSGVVVLDPLSMREGFTPEHKELRCPNCSECGRVTSKGFAKGSARCYGYESAMPVICRRFRCIGCPKSKAEKKGNNFHCCRYRRRIRPSTSRAASCRRRPLFCYPWASFHALFTCIEGYINVKNSKHS